VASSMANQLGKFFQHRKPSLAEDTKRWSAPDSWAVVIPDKQSDARPLHPSNIAAVDLCEISAGAASTGRHNSVDSNLTVITQYSFPMDFPIQTAENPDLWTIRIFRPIVSSGLSRSRRGSSPGLTFATFTCHFSTTALEFCAMLCKRFFILEPLCGVPRLREAPGPR
jgi:hypothetical protein